MKVKQLFYSLFFFLVLILLQSCIKQPDYQITLIYTGNLNGELEPCGCAEETDLGGILRRATMIKQIREEHPAAITISGGGIISSNTWQDKIKAEYIFSALKMMNYDAVGVQWRDLEYGVEFPKSFNLPWVSTNWANGDFSPFINIENGDYPVAFYSWIDTKEAPEKNMEGGIRFINDDIDVLNQSLTNSKREGVITILSTTNSLDEISPDIDLSLVDILMIPNIDEKYLEPRMIDGTLILQYGKRGMRIAKLNLVLDQNKRIIDFRHKIMKLPKSVEDAPELIDWYKEYNQEVKETYLANSELRKNLNSDESRYVGSTTCSTCHSEIYQIWEESRHSQAFHALELVNKGHDPSCIGCHTVGFQKEGGFIEWSITPNLLNVQCESCHGPAREHTESFGSNTAIFSTAPNEQTCRQCHVGDHSPKFSFDTYWPRIAHGTEY